MKFNKTFLPVLTATMLLLFVYACSDFLESTPQGALGGNVVANERGVETLLIGAYGALDGNGIATDAGLPWVASADNWLFGSVAGGDAHKGSTPGDQAPMNNIAAFNFTASNGYFNVKWTALYEGVSRTNAVLSLLEEVEGMSEQAKTEAAAEARFLRGHYYFELKKMFCDVPWVDEHTENPNQPNRVDSISIWAKIEADFKYAYNNLPEVQSDAGRVNKWAAAAYLAKAHVYQEEWQEAKALYDVIIPNGVTSTGVPYGLYSKFRNVFNPAMEKSNPGAVFAIQMVANDGTGTINNANEGNMLNFPYNSAFGCCGFFQPTQDLVNSYRTKNGLPIIDNYNNQMVKSDLGVNSDQHFTTYQGPLDPRLDWTAGRRGVPYHDWGPHPGKKWIRNQSYAGPYSPKKYVFWQAQAEKFGDAHSWAPGSAINYYVIRFADVLLMAAEAEVELGNLEQARHYVNEVRGRIADQNGWVRNEMNKAYAIAVVDSKSEMLATDAEAGDWVVRTDRNSTFQLLKGNPGNIDNWQEYKEPNYNIKTYTKPWSNQAKARKRVHFERKLEFAMEGQRYFDLVRWGIAEETLNDFFAYEGALFPDVSDGHFTAPKNRCYPIPQLQIDKSMVDGTPRLKQNPGY